MENQRLLFAHDAHARNTTLTRRLEQHFKLVDCKLDGHLPDTAVRFRPGILVLAVEAPDVRLCELVQTLRGDTSLASMKILLLATRHGDGASRLRLHESGVLQILSANTDPDELLVRLRSLSRLKSEHEIEDMKRQFRSLITHETSTPLNAISSYASMIAADTELSASNREMVGAILQASLLMEEKIERVLLLSDLSSDPVHDYHPIYSEDIFSSLEQKLRGLMPTRMGDVTFSSTANTRFMGSFDLIKVACWNLVENALKFSPAGSPVEVTDKVEGDDYLIRVTDQGPGIEVERINTLFAEFSVDDLLHHREGMGIGLSLCKRIAELHRGRITADNNPGGGACFSMRFPV